MSRPKKDTCKDHITATIDHAISVGMERYRDDPSNWIKTAKKDKETKATVFSIMEKPTYSKILEMALIKFLLEYDRKPKSINTPASNDTITQ